MQSFQFVVNIFCARIINKEKLTNVALCGTVGIIIGTAIIALFASHENVVNNVTQLLELYTKLPFLLYISLLGGLVLVVQVIFWIVHHRVEKRKFEVNHLSTFDKFADVFLPLSYAFLCAAFGVQAPVMAKSISELIRFSIVKEDQFTHWFAYLLIGLYLTFGAIWLIRLNFALKFYDALYIVPVIGCNLCHCFQFPSDLFMTQASISR